MTSPRYVVFKVASCVKYVPICGALSCFAASQESADNTLQTKGSSFFPTDILRKKQIIRVEPSFTQNNETLVCLKHFLARSVLFSWLLHHKRGLLRTRH